MTDPHVVLSVAGTDPGGAAGLAADLATFAALGAHGTCAVTAVTVQDSTRVSRVLPLSVDDVTAQIDAVLIDLPVRAAKVGMVGSAAVAIALGERLDHLPLVVDPVLVATSGGVLGDADVVAAYRDHLLPRATVVTPNRHEASALTGLASDSAAEDLALAVHRFGAAVVLTGGDDGLSEQQRCRDVVVDRDGTLTSLEHQAIRTRNDHGTGCTYSAALAVHLAGGRSLVDAAAAAQAFVADALRESRGWNLTRGRGPVAHTRTPSPMHAPTPTSKPQESA